MYIAKWTDTFFICLASLAHSSFREISALDFARETLVCHFVENRVDFLLFGDALLYSEHAIHIILLHGGVYYEFRLLNMISCNFYFPNFSKIFAALTRAVYWVFKLCCFRIANYLVLVEFIFIWSLRSFDLAELWTIFYVNIHRLQSFCSVCVSVYES